MLRGQTEAMCHGTVTIRVTLLAQRRTRQQRACRVTPEIQNSENGVSWEQLESRQPLTRLPLPKVIRPRAEDHPAARGPHQQSPEATRLKAQRPRAVVRINGHARAEHGMAQELALKPVKTGPAST